MRSSDLRKLWIEGPGGRLEALLRVACPARAAAVISHPHPQHGGTLHNPVVFHTDRELHRAGWTTLRFNFRGVGSSEGSFDNGMGEVGDVGAALNWLRGIAPRVPLFAVGYSFGSVCSILHAIEDPGVAALIAIGMPVKVYDLADAITRLARPLAVIQGSEDEMGLPASVRRVLEAAEPKGSLYELEGASHLLPGRAADAAALVVEAATTLLGSLAPRS